MDNILAITFDKKETENLERAYERSNCKTKNEFFELLVTRFFEELDEDTPFTMYFERNTTPSINRFIAFIEHKFGLNNNPPTMLNTVPFPFIPADALTNMGKTYFARFNDETMVKLIELTNTCPNYTIMMANLVVAIIATKVDSFDSDEKTCQENMTAEKISKVKPDFDGDTLELINMTAEKISKVKPDFDGDTLDIPKLMSYDYMMFNNKKSGYYFDNDKLSNIIKTDTLCTTYAITSVERIKRPKEYNRFIILNKTSKRKEKYLSDMLDNYKKKMEQLIERVVNESLIINREYCDPFIKCSLKISGLDIKTFINNMAKDIGVKVQTEKMPTTYKFVVDTNTGEIFYPENLQIKIN